MSGFLEALSVPTSFYLSSLKPMIQTESLSNRHRNEDHRNDQVGSELWFINCLWGMRLTQCSVSACCKHSDEPPGASFKSVTAAAWVLLRDSLLPKAMPFPGWRTPAMMDQGVSVRASQFQHNSGLLWWNIPAPRLLCGHPRLTLALHCSLISPYIKCPPFSFFGRYLPKRCLLSTSYIGNSTLLYFQRNRACDRDDGDWWDKCHDSPTCVSYSPPSQPHALFLFPFINIPISASTDPMFMDVRSSTGMGQPTNFHPTQRKVALLPSVTVSCW